MSGCLSLSGIPGPIFSNRTRIITRTRPALFGHELKSGPIYLRWDLKEIGLDLK